MISPLRAINTAITYARPKRLFALITYCAKKWFEFVICNVIRDCFPINTDLKLSHLNDVVVFADYLDANVVTTMSFCILNNSFFPSEVGRGIALRSTPSQVSGSNGKSKFCATATPP